MNLDALNKRLATEGYGPLVSELRPWGLMIQDLYLEVIDGLYTITWTERGEVTETVYASHDEEAACNCFLETVSGRRWHFRTFQDARQADMLTERLGAAGITPWRNDIPNFNGPGDARYRIFVLGRDLMRAEAVAAQGDQT